MVSRGMPDAVGTNRMTRDPRFTFFVIGVEDSGDARVAAAMKRLGASVDRVLRVDGKATNLHVRQWSEGWWCVVEFDAFGTPSVLYTMASNGFTVFGRARRWRSIEKAEDAAVELWTSREGATFKAGEAGVKTVATQPGQAFEVTIGTADESTTFRSKGAKHDG